MAGFTVSGEVSEQKKSKRVNFWASKSLIFKLGNIAKELRLSESDIIRRALTRFIEGLEREHLEKALEEGYKANYAYYSQSSKDWEIVDLD